MSGPLQVMIVDDEPPARERLRELLRDASAEVPNRVVAEAANGPQALALLPECGAELALLDIHMPGMNGIELARHLLRLERPPDVVFVTAHDRYALQAFDVNALDYLLKPVRLARLVAALGKARSGVQPGAQQLADADPGPRRYFSVGERGKVTLVPVHEILFLKAELKYVTLRTREREFVVEEPLSQLEHELGDAFVRVHRNCLVARGLIRGVEQLSAAAPDSELHWGVRLEGHTDPIPVSRRQWSTVKNLLKGRN